jgi:hypothetical protein
VAGLSPLPLAIATWIDPDRFASCLTSSTAGFWLALLIAAIQFVFSNARQAAGNRAHNPLIGNEVTS